MVTQFTITFSRTINLGNFESARVEASVTVNLNTDLLDNKTYQEWKETAQQELRKLLEETYKHQYADRKKIA